MTNIDMPIIVPASAAPEIATTLLRYGLTAIGGVLVTRGFLPADADVNAIVGAIVIVGSALWGAVKVKRGQQVKADLAEMLPDPIAQAR